MSAELDRKLSQLFHEVTVLAEEEMHAYRRVSASTVRALISAASGLVRLREKKAEALKARVAELEEELGGWMKSHDEVNARCIALSERYD